MNVETSAKLSRFLAWAVVLLTACFFIPHLTTAFFVYSGAVNYALIPVLLSCILLGLRSYFSLQESKFKWLKTDLVKLLISTLVIVFSSLLGIILFVAFSFADFKGNLAAALVSFGILYSVLYSFTGKLPQPFKGELRWNTFSLMFQLYSAAALFLIF